MDAFVGIYLDGRTRLRPGQPLRGRVELEAYRPIEITKVEVRLVCTARRRHEDEVPVHHQVVARRELPGLVLSVDSEPLTAPFELEVPEHLPPTYEGEMIAVGWRVEAHVSIRGRRDIHAREEVVVHRFDAGSGASGAGTSARIRAWTPGEDLKALVLNSFFGLLFLGMVYGFWRPESFRGSNGIAIWLMRLLMSPFLLLMGLYALVDGFVLRPMSLMHRWRLRGSHAVLEPVVLAAGETARLTVHLEVHHASPLARCTATLVGSESFRENRVGREPTTTSKDIFRHRYELLDALRDRTRRVGRTQVVEAQVPIDLPRVLPFPSWSGNGWGLGWALHLAVALEDGTEWEGTLPLRITQAAQLASAASRSVP